MHPGEVVTRERLRKEIWGEGTFVDFEHSLNAAVNKAATHTRRFSRSPDVHRDLNRLRLSLYRLNSATVQPSQCDGCRTRGESDRYCERIAR